MQFLTASASLDAVPHIRIHGAARPLTRLLLAAEPGSATPAPLRAQTVAEQALHFLAAGWPSPEAPGDLEAAGAERFDGDGIVAAWALTNPDAALAMRQTLIGAARAAAFHVGEQLEPAAFVCTLHAYRDPIESPIATVLAGASAAERDALLYSALLPLTGTLLTNPRSFDLLWIGEYSDVLQSRAMAESGAVQVEHDAELDLVVLDTPLALHPLVHYSLTQGRSRLLTVRSENTYTLEYRREGWAWPGRYGYLRRLRLELLAARLNLFERNDGRWRADPVELPAPVLTLRDSRGRPAPSSIDRETLVAEVVDFLRTHRHDPHLLWDHGRGVQ